MPEFETGGYQGMWLPGQRLDESVGLCVVLKRRFKVDTARATCEPADSQAPVRLMAEYYVPDDPVGSSVQWPGELALEKAQVDVIVNGSAHAPGGRPVKEFEVGLKITGLLEERLRILGPRVVQWHPPRKVVSNRQRARGKSNVWATPTFSEPEPIASLPLRYEYAYGGAAPVIIDEVTAARAAEMAAEAEEEEARRERKKEIVEDLMNPPEKGGGEEASPVHAEMGAFSEADASLADGVVPPTPDEPSMEVVSALRLGEQAARDQDGVPQEPIDDVASVEAGGTGVLDVADLEVTGTRDELRQVLDVRAREAAKELVDEDGTQRLRAADADEVVLSDDAWPEGAKEPASASSPDDAPDVPKIPYPGNPTGRGFCLSGERAGMDGLALPCIEYPGEGVRPEDLLKDMAALDLGAIGPTAGWGAYGMGWYPRGRLAGVYPWDVDKAQAGIDEALAGYDPEDPDDRVAIDALEAMEMPVMQRGWFQEANPRLQLSRLDGHEDVHVENMTPDGHLYFKLPGVHPRATIDLGDGEERLSLRLDTLVIDLEDPAEPAVEILWRGWRPLSGFAALDSVPNVLVHVESVDQARWLADQRKAAMQTEEHGSQGTQELALGEDGAVLGDAADAAYQEGFQGASVPVADDDGTAVFDQGRDMRLTDDAWREGVDSQAAGADEAAAEAAKAAEAERLKAAREEARALVDEEFGRTKKGKKGRKVKKGS